MFFFIDNRTTPTKVVLSCFGLLVGLWQYTKPQTQSYSPATIVCCSQYNYAVTYLSSGSNSHETYANDYRIKHHIHGYIVSNMYLTKCTVTCITCSHSIKHQYVGTKYHIRFIITCITYIGTQFQTSRT